MINLCEQFELMRIAVTFLVLSMIGLACSSDEEATAEQIVRKDLSEIIETQWIITSLEHKNGILKDSAGQRTFNLSAFGFKGNLSFLNRVAKSDFGYHYQFIIQDSSGMNPKIQSGIQTREEYFGSYYTYSINGVETDVIDQKSHLFAVTNLSDSTMTLTTKVEESDSISTQSYDLIVSLKKQ